MSTVARVPRVALVSRGDPLTPHLRAALVRRYPLTVDVDVELRGLRRAAVAAATFRPTWSRWADRYMKSNLGFRARSGLAGRQLDADRRNYDVVVQVHTLFRTQRPGTTIYVDCTYRQAMRGWPEWTPSGPRARRRWLAAEAAAYRDAVHLFAFTGETRRSLIEDYRVDPRRISVVGAGVNFVHSARREPATTPTVLFVGKDFRRKGGEVLLRAFERVRAAVPQARLQLVGTTLPDPAPDGVEVLGLVTDRAQMARLYAQATVFCLPSLFDPSPLVVLEAMAHGLPSVLSHDASHHVRGLVEHDDAGFAVPTGDAAGLADALIALLRDDGLAHRLGVAAEEAMASGFRWDHVVERMAPVLEASVSGQAVRRSENSRS